MAHVVSFEVTALAGRSTPLRRKLDRHLNVFFGHNGSGKTSLLRILDSAMTNDARRIRNVPFEEATVGIYSIAEQSVIVRHIDRKTIKRHSQSDTASYSVNPAGMIVRGHRPIPWASTPKSNDRFSHLFLPTSRVFAPTDVTRGGQSIAEDDELASQFEATIIGEWQRYMTELLTEVRSAQAVGLARILSEVLAARREEPASSPRDSKKAWDRVKAFLTRQQMAVELGSYQAFVKTYRRSHLLRNVVHHIDAVEQQIEQAVSPRTQLAALLTRMFEGKRVTLDDRSIGVVDRDDVTIGLGNLSSGEQHALRILMDAIRVKESALIIDEPEISLHIDWQSSLLESISRLNPDCQLVVATHSPEIMARIDDRHIQRI